MSKIYIVPIEKLESRYTGQWYEHIPRLLCNAGLMVEIIEGPIDIPEATTAGAFLNFGGTNVYKAVQLEKISRMFCEGKIKEGDQFLFTDAWNPSIINVKYMSTLLNIPVKIHGFWHSGNYDKNDFLGRVNGDASWLYHTEQALFNAIDHNHFATEFHINLFAETYGETSDNEWQETLKDKGKIIRTGWPMEYMPSTLEKYKWMKKKDLILFPHRIAPEKQVEIFRDLARAMPEYEFIVCQDEQLSKHEYHTLLGESKIVFSASKQETLGISAGAEGPLLGAIPLSPDRLSYSEIFENYPNFLYPSEWTEDWNSYIVNKDKIIQRLKYIMNNYDTYLLSVENYIDSDYKKYFQAKNMLIILGASDE